MEKLKPFDITGGARVGWMNASWPLAQLSATSDNLTISVFLLGTYRFTPNQVFSIERYVIIPVLGWGIQIRHGVSEYPRRIIFFSLGNPDRLLSGISGSGFQPAATPSTTDDRVGIPMRWSATIVAVAVWNGLFLLDLTRSDHPNSSPGLYSCVALLLTCGFALGTLKFIGLTRRSSHLKTRAGYLL
jgi:hypothetical protein